MPKIRVLAPDLIAKIAAGEVVEKPASVVKELVENALDANSTVIRIILENSGLNKIIVIDNGHGMDKADLEIAHHAHSTSKINNQEDLLKINSLGFRGEALSSIVSVSQITLKSKIKTNNFGYQLTIKNSQAQELKPCGMPTGTNVCVENLFANIPARKKFLKSHATELRHIIETITNLALAHPEIKFFLSHNQRIIFDLPKQSHELRIRSLLGTPTYKQLLNLNYEGPNFKLYGFIANANALRKSAKKQHLFINQRPVKHQAINSAIKNTYTQLTGQKLHPPFVLFIDVPATYIDVNIHPQKHEVRFINEDEILNLSSQAIRDTLTQAGTTKTDQNNFYTTSNNAKKLILKDNSDFINTAQILKNIITPWQTKNQEISHEILQINNLYLISKTKNSILIIDQHAAHERILYEQFLTAFAQAQNSIYKLATPLILETSFTEANILKENLDAFKNLGFVIEHLYENTFKVLSSPKIFKGRDIVKIINEVLDDLQEKSVNNNQETKPIIDSRTDQILKYLSCRGAVKAGDYLSPQERENLITKLFDCETPHLCPHGRPAVIEVGLNELGKMFRRK